MQRYLTSTSDSPTYPPQSHSQLRVRVSHLFFDSSQPPPARLIIVGRDGGRDAVEQRVGGGCGNLFDIVLLPRASPTIERADSTYLPAIPPLQLLHIRWVATGWKLWYWSPSIPVVRVTGFPVAGVTSALLFYGQWAI